LAGINWAEFKEYKKYSNRNDNFEILLDFIKSYYNMVNPREIYGLLSSDDTAQMMLEKRNITDAEDMENFLFKL